MKITNATARVIGVLGTDLMPDQSMEITAKQAATPSIATVIKMGFLTVDNKAELEKEQKNKALEEARRQIMDELRAAGKLKEDDDSTANAADTEQPAKKTRKPKVQEAFSE